MRIRRNPIVRKTVHGLPALVVREPDQLQGKWRDVFAEPHPLHVELGCGKGTFLKTMAGLCPEINFLGVERSPEVIYQAARKNGAQTANLRLLLLDIKEIESYFAPAEISRLYLNFSDPWPKAGHAKRRLTHPNFLQVYKNLLKKDGEIFLKTDNQAFFTYSQDTLAQVGFSLGRMTHDLHHSFVEGNIMTEYEEKFSALGQSIYRLEAYN